MVQWVVDKFGQVKIMLVVIDVVFYKCIVNQTTWKMNEPTINITNSFSATDSNQNRNKNHPTNYTILQKHVDRTKILNQNTIAEKETNSSIQITLHTFTKESIEIRE